MEFHTGDKPGAGSYTCTTCGEIITLESDDDELPVCPVCGEKEFTKNE